MQKIITHLWFDDTAEEAAHLYVSLFKNSSIGKVNRYNKSGAQATGQKEGTVMSLTFTLDGQEYMALNGGPVFTFTEAISLFVTCENQEEVDMLWEKLSEGGSRGQCGWLKDRYGLSWQIVPSKLGELMNGSEPNKSRKVMEAMLTMHKLDIATLQAAYDQG